MNRAIQVGVGLGLAMAAALCLGQASPPQSQRQIALALEQQGKNIDAAIAWRAYLKAHPSSPEPYAHLGLLEARQEHYEEAVPLYRKALAMDPTMPGLRLNLGLALFKNGDLKQSIQEFKLLLKSQPRGSNEAQRLTILIGMAHYGLGEYAAAVPYLKTAAARDTKNLPLLLALAHSCLWSRQYHCVMDVYHEILMLNAESAESDMLAGEALNELKNTPGAILQFRAAIQANPKEPNVHFGLGYLLWTQTDYREAASEFQAELANDPDHIQAMLYLADSEVHLNQFEAATPLLERLLKLDSGLGLAYLDLGIIHAEAGRNEDALREMQEAARLDPGDVNAHWRLARLYRTMGKNEEAKVEFAKASSLNKAADDALFNKINNAHARSRPAQNPSAAPEK